MTTKNIIERRFDLYDTLRDLKFPPFCSQEEYDRIFNERLKAVQELVEINRALGEYDNEPKEIPATITQLKKSDNPNLLNVIVAINNELSKPSSRMYDRIRDIVTSTLKDNGYEL